MSGSSADQTKPGDDTQTEDAKSLAIAAMEAIYGDADADDGDEDLESSDQEDEVEGDESEADDDTNEDGDDADDEGSDEGEDEESEGDENADDTVENQEEEPETERDVGFAKSKRFRQMNEQLKAAKSKAEKLEIIEQKLAAVGIEVDGLEEGLAVIAALKNPTAPGADKVLRPHLERIAAVNGSGALDQDLQEDVANGDLSEKRAREIQAARAREAYRQTAERETAEQRAQRANLEAIDGLYREFGAADPDFSKKKDAVQALAMQKMQLFYQQTGKGPGVAKGLEIIREAKAQIDALIPVRKAVEKPESRVTSSTGKAKKKLDTSSKPPAEGREGILANIASTLSKRPKK